MKKFFCTILSLTLIVLQIPIIRAAEEGTIMITNPKAEGFAEQLGVSVSPAFSWGYTAGEGSMYQEAYRIVINDVYGDEVYDSGKVSTANTQGITIDKTLEPGTKYTWDLFTWLDNGEETESLGNTFVTGIKTWQGKWITGGDKSFYARQTFNAREGLVGAYAFVCGLGQFKLFLNGEKMGNHELDPGWTDYDESVQYVTFDITDHVKNGENAVGVSVGNGWYIPQREHHFYIDMRPFADSLALICDIVLEYSDGTREIIASDENWKICESATTMANVYGSEAFDARLYPEGWNTVGFDGGNWKSAAVIDGPKGELVPQSQPPVTIKKIYDTVNVINVDRTTNIFDLGQNMSGMFEIYVSGPAGATVTITPAEKLNADGGIEKTVDTVLTYTLKGTGDVEVWKPDFSYSGGRWIQIDGAIYGDAPVFGQTVIHDVKGHFITNSAVDAGVFTASDERYEQIYNLILKAMESNLQSVHTDCPTIEKLGWLETSQLMAPSMIYNKSSRELLRKIARDATEAQEESGLIPDVAPAYPHFNGGFWDSPAWGSCVVITPWLLYQYYGDTYSLKENYGAMKKYAAYLKSKEDGNGMLTHGLGDWGISPQTGESRANIETAIYYYDLYILADTARLFGYDDDAKYFGREAERAKANYNNTLLRYSEAVGAYAYQPITQANQAIALYLGLVPEDKESDVVDCFRKTIESGSIDSGEIGLRFVFQAAAKYGFADTIHEMITRPEHRSYYRFVLMGETTLPEFWVDDARSRNHDMLGHIMEWFYSGVGGITPAAPGFAEISIAPRPPKALESANVEYDSVKGKIVSSWEHTQGHFSLHTELPVNTGGTVSVPTFGMTDITVVYGDTVLYQNGRFEGANGINFVSADENGITFTVENGSHDFALTGVETCDEENNDIEYTPSCLPVPSLGSVSFTPSVSSDVNNWGWSLAASKDGVTDSVPGAMGWSSALETRINHDEWYMLDFGTVRAVSRLDLYPRNDQGNEGKGFPIDFIIEASRDGDSWTTLKEIKNYPAPTSTENQSFTFSKTDCRYIRIYATKLQLLPDGYRMQLSEVTAYNEGPLWLSDIKDSDGFVSGRIYCAEPGEYTVYCASYSRDNVLLNVSSGEHLFAEPGSADFSTQTDPAACKVSVFGWKKGMEPIMDKLTVAEPLDSIVTSAVGQNSGAFHKLRPRTNTVVYSFTLIDNGSNDSGIMLGGSSALNATSGNYFADGSIVILFTNGAIYTRDTNAKTEVARYTVGKDVEIQINADIAANTYDLYVGDEAVASGVSFRTPEAAIDTLALVENGGGAAFDISNFTAE